MGDGDLALKTPTGEKMETGLSLAMAALRVRGALLSRAGYELAVKSDFAFVQTESEKTTGLASAEAQTRRLRLVLEGSRERDLGAGSLTPSVEVGLRYDGGDAETGAGVELGGGVRAEYATRLRASRWGSAYGVFSRTRRATMRNGA